MNITAIAQIASPIVSLIFIMVLGVGYYYQWRVSRETLQEMREERFSGGRPQVIVSDNYGRLPEVDVVVRNISTGPAMHISFEFSAPVEAPDGTVISELPYFKNGLQFLAPHGEITAYWGHLDELLPFLRKKGLDKGITVTINYRELTGVAYKTHWNLNPFIYEHRRFVEQRDLSNTLSQTNALLGRLVDAVEEKTSFDGKNEGLRKQETEYKDPDLGLEDEETHST